MEINLKSERIEAQGWVLPGFEGVAVEFERNFVERDDVGAAFAAVHRGQLVVDLWGGEAAPGHPWTQNTLQVVFSGTKGLMASCMLKLVERGQLDLDSPIARYWPKFAKNGKETVRVRHVLSHGAGLPGLVEPISSDDWADPDRIEQYLADQRLPSDPDAFHCYQPLTAG